MKNPLNLNRKNLEDFEEEKNLLNLSKLDCNSLMLSLIEAQ